MAFENTGLDDGFYKSNQVYATANGSALVIFYSKNLGNTEQKIIQAKGKIVKPTFSFRGGRRFHFLDPNGNEFAVWSDKKSK